MGLGDVMLWRGVVLFFLAVTLLGCASERTGTDYFAVAQKIGAPKSGQSRVVVLQEKRSGLADYCVCDIKLDDKPVGKLKPGTYVYADTPAGRHRLFAAESLFPADTVREVTAEAGRTHFFVARPSQRHTSVTGSTYVGGLAGALVASAVTSGSDNPGPIDFLPLDEAAARTAIADLQLAD